MDVNIVAALIGAFSGAIVAAIGWFVVGALESRRDVVARRDNAARDHLEKQIEQLYGPLSGLIQHTNTVFNLAAKKLPTYGAGKIDFARFSGRDGDIWHFFVEKYFLPLNAEIRNLIQSKMHLLDAGIKPESFDEFFAHEAEFEALHTLWKEKNVPSSEIAGKGWPTNFGPEVQSMLESLRRRHQVFLQRLGASGRQDAGS